MLFICVRFSKGVALSAHYGPSISGAVIKSQRDRSEKQLRKPRQFINWLGLVTVFWSLSQLSFANDTSSLAFEQASRLALSNDALDTKIGLQKDAAREAATASGQLEDPTLMLGMLNVPLDDFDTAREPMTQFRVGIKQMFPPGRTLSLREQKGFQQVDVLEQLRQDRKLKVTRATRLAWLDSYYWRKRLELLREDLDLLSQVLTNIRQQFEVGGRSVQEVLSVQLEETRLRDRLLNAEYNKKAADVELGRWTGLENSSADTSLPGIQEKIPNLPLTRYLGQHPTIAQMDEVEKQLKLDAELVRQSYQPSFALEMAYAYRRDDLMSNDRADFGSVIFSMSLPLFPSVRQDRRLQQTEKERHAISYERSDSLRAAKAEVEKELTQYTQLKASSRLYTKKLLPLAQQAADASLSGYQSNSETFTQALRAYTALQRTRQEALQNQVDEYRSLVRLAYWLPGQVFSVRSPNAVEPETVSSTHSMTELF